MKKKYYVEVPIAGYATVEVEADDTTRKSEIIDMAVSKAADDDVQEYDFYRRLIQGNVCFVNRYEAEIVDEEDIEEDE